METSGKRRLRMGKKGQSTRSGKTLVENRSVRTRSCLDSEAIKTFKLLMNFMAIGKKPWFVREKNIVK